MLVCAIIPHYYVAVTSVTTLHEYPYLVFVIPSNVDALISPI